MYLRYVHMTLFVANAVVITVNMLTYDKIASIQTFSISRGTGMAILIVLCSHFRC